MQLLAFSLFAAGIVAADQFVKYLTVANIALYADVPYESSFAGYKDWFIQRFRRPGYTIEAGRGENPLPLDQFEEIYRNNLPILVTAAQGITSQNRTV